MAVSTASQRGIALFLHDASTARASDELMARKVFERDPRLEGWLTEVIPDRSVVVVDFVGTDDGKPAVLMSRAVDSNGYVQPTVQDLQKKRAIVGFVQHHNAIQPWAVNANGEVRNVIGQA